MKFPAGQSRDTNNVESTSTDSPSSATNLVTARTSFPLMTPIRELISTGSPSRSNSPSSSASSLFTIDQEAPVSSNAKTATPSNSTRTWILALSERSPRSSSKYDDFPKRMQIHHSKGASSSLQAMQDGISVRSLLSQTPPQCRQGVLCRQKRTVDQRDPLSDIAAGVPA